MTYYGLKLGQGLENQASRPHKKFEEHPPVLFKTGMCVMSEVQRSGEVSWYVQVSIDTK